MGRKLETFEVSGRYVQSPDDIAMYVRRVRESAPPLILAIVGSIFLEDWIRVMLQNFETPPYPRVKKIKLKKKIACMF